MDDSQVGRGAPVLSDPWVRAHTPTQEHLTPNMDRKKRRSWFTGNTPVKAPQDGRSQVSKRAEEEVPTLQITHFTKKVMMSFDNVKLNATRTLTLRLENPHDFPQEVMIEKFPFSKGFSLLDNCWELDANECMDVPVSWTPTEEKNVRELVTFKCEGVFRLQLIILGTVKAPPKKKNVNRRSTFTARKAQAVQSKTSIAITNPRRETFVRKKSPRSQNYVGAGKENRGQVATKNQGPVVTKKADTPNTRKARARSMGLVLEHVLTPRQNRNQGQVERVVVGGKVCTFSPQLTSKAILEITGESPFADGKIKNEPARETLDVCEGMSPLLKTSRVDDFRKTVLVREITTDPFPLLPQEQTSTVTKSKSREFDERAGKPPRVLFMNEEAELSKIGFTPAASILDLGQSVERRLTSTRIDDSLCHLPQDVGPLLQEEEERTPSSMEDDSLEEDRLSEGNRDHNQKSAKRDHFVFVGNSPKVEQTADLDKVEVEAKKQPNAEEMMAYSSPRQLEEDEAEVILKQEICPEELPLDKAEQRQELIGSEEQKDDDISVQEEQKIEEPCDVQEKDGPVHPVVSSSVQDEVDIEPQPEASPTPLEQESSKESQTWRISLGGAEPSVSPSEPVKVVKKKQEASVWRISPSSGKRAPTRKPVVKKPSASQMPSRPPSAASVKARPSLTKSDDDFVIHKSAVTGKINRNGKRLSDPIQNPATSKKSRPSPEHKSSTKASVAKKTGTTSLSSSRQFNRTVALRKAAATGKQSQPKAPAASRPKTKPKAPRTVKGVPMAKLQLVKPTHSALPRHPLPFAAKNIFYDERWMEKEDRGFTCWLNYVLTPDIDTPKDPNKNVKIDAHLLCLEGASRVGPAPSKEDLSLRAYTARRRLNRLRRGACMLFQSEPVIRVMQKLEAEVEKGRLVIREDKMLHADLGIKQELLDLILSYNPLWLRIGLETIYGELLPIQDNSDVYGISRFVVTRLLGNPDIAAVYAHPTVPNLFGEGYQAALAQFTLKKFLMLVFFLDRSKLTRLIDHDPCLFCKDSQVKSSRDLLLEFSRRYLKGEGDITRHLSFMGYVVTHVQRPLDEFDFAVTKLAVDLRCGVRLSRVVELLTQNWALSGDLRVPAISRLQKIHNVEVAFKTLKDRGINVEGGGLNERAIVDGHREKTLELLWRIIFHYQVGVMLNEQQLREEISFLTKNRKLRQELSALKAGGQRSNSASAGPHLYFKSPRLMLLMDWCKAVCSFYDMEIENFTVSFCDGRALCLLVHHYHPGLLPYLSISQDTTLMQFQREEKEDLNSSDSSFDGTWSHTFSPSTGKETDHDKLLSNERLNFKLLYEKVRELGGVPMMVRSADMSNTIPDEKVVITYVSYLCARLLDLRQETRAVRTIQLAWRAHQLRKERKMRVVKEKAAMRIQSAVREFLVRRRQQRLGQSVMVIQTAARGFLARRRVKRLREQQEAQRHVTAATILQAGTRGFLTRRHMAQRHASATLVQAAVRGHLVRAKLMKMRTAAVVIQRWVRSQRETNETRQRFIKLKRAAVVTQSAWRGIMTRKMMKKILAARKIQSAWRGFFQRRCFMKQQSAAIAIQASYRKYTARSSFLCLKRAVRNMQVLVRAKVKGHVQRQEYLALCDAAITVQKHYRGQVARREVLRISSAVKIQAAFRGHQQRAHFLKLKASAVQIQASVRMYQARRRYTELRHAAVVLQARYRAKLLSRQVCRDYNIARGAAITIQSALRSCLMRRKFLKTKQDIILMQAAIRRHQAVERYINLRSATITLQRQYRAVLLGRQICKEYNVMRGAAITIQATVRSHQVRRQFLKTKQHIILIQAAIRRHQAVQRFRKLRAAAIAMQRQYRAVLLGRKICKEYNVMRGAAITIQATVRSHQVRRQFLKTRRDVILIQASIRKHQAVENYRKLRSATITIQRQYRAILLGKQICKDYNITRGAAITIQAALRSYLVRRQFLKMKHEVTLVQAAIRKHQAVENYRKLRAATITIQRQYRAVLLGRQVCEDYNRMRGAAITIQSALRSHLVRRQFLKTRQHVILIQATIRRHQALEWYRKLRAAAITMQRQYRAVLVGRQICKEYNVMRGAAITLQATVRSYLARQQFLKTKRDVILVQAIVRRHLTQERYRKLRAATITIQTQYRAVLLGRQICKDYNMMRGAAITIQAAIRSHRLRQQFLKIKQDIILIQAAIRRCQAVERFRKLRAAAIIIQRRYRAVLLGRQTCEDYNMMRGAAITIQAAFRSHQGRREFLKKQQDVTLVQALIRRHQAQERYRKLKAATIRLQRQYRAVLLGRQTNKDYNIMRGAAITIQSAIRSHKVRRQFLKTKQDIILIQAAIRRHQAVERYRKLRAATITMQRQYRAVLLGRQICKDYNIMRGAAITIQATVRSFQVRQQFLKMKQNVTDVQAVVRRHQALVSYRKLRAATIRLQRQYRAVLLGRQICKDYNVMRGAAITIQAAVRSYQARKDFVETRKAVILVQATVKRFLAKKRYNRLRQATIVFQTRYRAILLGREVCREYDVLRQAIVSIQSVRRGVVARREFLRQKTSAIRIQAWVRSHLVRQEFLQLRKAAIVLQTRYRSLLTTRTVQAEYCCTRAAIITLQAAYRGHLQRKEYLRIRSGIIALQAAFRCHIVCQKYLKTKEAAIVLQRRYRALVLGRQTKEEYHMTRGAAITVQAAFRGLVRRKEYLRLKSATVTIQTALRRMIARKLGNQIHQQFLKTKQDVTLVQAVVRMHQAQERYRKLRAATIILQKQYRAILLGRQICKEYSVMRGAAITIQANIRSYLVRQQFRKTRRDVILIQAAIRRHQALERFRNLRAATITLQRQYRAVLLGRQTSKDYNIMRGAAITLQAAVRSYKARRQFLKTKQDVTNVQAIVRMHLARERYRKLRTAAITMQRQYRAILLGRKSCKEYNVMKGAAITIQATVRSHQVRRQFLKIRKDVIIVQAAVRRHQAQERFRKLRAATITLQRQYRAILYGRQICKEYNIMRGAAITIQAALRSHIVRQQFLQTRQHVTLVQAAIRKHQAQKSYRKLRAATITIQRQYRAILLGRQISNDYMIMRGAAITIQAAVRGHQARHQFLKIKQDVTIVQAVVRRHQIQERFRKLKAAATTIQRQYRAILLGRQICKEYNIMRGAAITIQAAVRRYQSRKNFVETRKAVILVQAIVKRFLAQKKYNRLRQATIVFQTRYRAILLGREVCREYDVTRQAIVSIQSVRRGVVARREFLRQKSSAIRIQAWVRSHLGRKEFLQLRKAAVVLQTRYRSLLTTRTVQAEYCCTRAAIITLQAAYRGHLQRKEYLRIRSGIIALQAAVRCHLVRQKYMKTKEAAIVLQRRYRALVLGRQTKEKYHMTRGAVITMQAAFRGLVRRKEYLRLKSATVTIQTALRKTVAQKQFIRIRQAVLVLQTRYRARITMKQVSRDFATKRRSAIVLQTVFRGYLQRRSFLRQRSAAVTIQAHVRGYQQRRDYLRIQRAVTVIQTHYRRHVSALRLQAERQARLAELQAFADRTKAHLSVIRLQRAFRNYRLRRLFKERMDAIVTIQTWMRAKLQRLGFLKLRSAALVVQRAARRRLAKKNAAAVVLQSVARVWLARQYVRRMQSSALKLQALWRGHRVRRSIKSKKIAQARARVQRANRNATEDKKLCNRTVSALDYLLNYRTMSRILETLISLEVVSRLSKTCCQRLVEGGAVPVLYTLMSSCNRSVPCMEIIQYIISILLNLAKNESTQHAVLSADGSVSVLLELLQIYREKNAAIFCKTCLILGNLMKEAEQVQIILANPKTKDKVASLHKLTSRKQVLDQRRIKTKSLNASSSCFNASSFLGASFNASAASSFAAGTPHKRRKSPAHSSSDEWSIEDPMKAIQFLKTMVDRV